MSWMDWTGSTADQREQAFGTEFREIHITRVHGGPLMVECVLNGRVTVLCGDPRAALLVHLGGTEPGEVAS